MNEKDYLNKATAKIVLSSEKSKVCSELSDHIELKKAGFKEIGYDDEAAEEKAIEEMGNADDIADTLGTIHNNFYNPIGDIIATVIWLLLLCAGYMVNRNYLFGDPGTISILLATCALSIGIFFFASAIIAKKKSFYKSFFLFAGGVGTGVYNYLILSEVNRITLGSKENLISYFKESNVNFEAVPPSNKILFAVIIILGVIMFLFCLSVLIYGAKKLHFANSRLDNKISKATVKICAVLCVISVIAAACLCAKFFTDKKAFRDDYLESLRILQDISENCTTNQEVLDYLDKNKIEYVMESDWVCDVPRIFAAFKIEFQYNSDEEVDPLNLQNDYLYKITVSVPVNMFDNQMNSLTLSEYKTDEKTLDEITSYLSYNYNGYEKQKFYSSFVPEHCTFEYYETDFSIGRFEYNFVTGSPNYLKNYTYDFSIENEEYFKFKKKAEKIKKIIQKDIDASHEKIARDTNTTLLKPRYTKDEWESSIDMFGTSFDRFKPKLKMKYEELYEYKISDKWKFTLHINGKGKRDAVRFYYEDFSFSSMDLNLTGSATIGFGEGNDLHSKIAYNGGYFDRNGRYYKNASLIRYYTKDGDSYSYYSEVNFQAENEEDFKQYYLVDGKGNIYDYDDCFIDEDGWLCFYNADYLQLTEENVYKDSSGKIYTKPFETNWDNKGNLLSAEKQKELIEALRSEYLLEQED